MEGVIVLNKPPHIRSAKAVAAVKRLLPRGTKIGHAGTLDPFATGVLVLLIGKGTRLCETIMSMPKTYDATIKLGATTQTDDPESPEQPYLAEPGNIGNDITVPTALNRPPALEGVLEAAKRLVGPIMQRPPVFSALKIEGKRASDRVRKGHVVRLEPRPVHVYSFTVKNYDWPIMSARIECGRGTYIRALARDLGDALQTGAYVTQLCRTRVGEFAIEQSVAPSQLSADNLVEHLRPLPPTKPV